MLRGGLSIADVDAAVAAKRWAAASLVEMLGRDPHARHRGERGAAAIEDFGDE